MQQLQRLGTFKKIFFFLAVLLCCIGLFTFVYFPKKNYSAPVLIEGQWSQTLLNSKTTTSPRTCYEPLTVAEYAAEYSYNSFRRSEFKISFEVVSTSPKIIILPSSHQYQYQREETAERATTALMRSFYSKGCSSKGNLILDMGANDGFYAVLASSYGCRVISFEPQNLCVRRLALGITINQIYPLVDLRQFIVGRNTSTSIYVNDNICSGDSKYYRTHTERRRDETSNLPNQNSLLVKTQRIDDVVCGEEVLLWHLDVEGGELEVLLSGETTLKSGKVQNLIVEWYPSRWASWNFGASDGNNVLKILDSVGYVVHDLGSYKDQGESTEQIVAGLKKIEFKNTWYLPDGEYLFSKSS